LPINAAVIDSSITNAYGRTGVTSEIISPPSAVGNDNHQVDVLYAFNELQDFTLTDDLRLDGSSVISAGTIVTSHYVFYDPRLYTEIGGTFTFDTDILGVISETSALSDSDFLGATGTSYLSPSLRGLEGEDSYSFLDEILNINFKARTPGDYIRVITAGAPVPIPAAAWLFVSGLLGLISYSNRNKTA
ncbi:MAG: hypothetical protein GY779_00345, partial [Gammaproteobacteria bacterium]|nr:hypothetical protein [Gammaproteobacteria bacterium]